MKNQTKIQPTNKYKFRAAEGKFSKKAEIYGRELERIKKEKGLTPENVLKSARKTSSPLHECFNWDDSEAAERYRLLQAGNLIRIIIVVENEQRAFENVVIKKPNKKDESVYLSQEEVLDSKEYRKQMLIVALRELSFWKSKYQFYAELKGIVKEIKKVEKKLIPVPMQIMNPKRKMVAR